MSLALPYFRRYEFPDKKFVNDSYTHNLTSLLKLAGLDEALRAEASSNSRLDVNWAVVKDWNEVSRYREATTSDAHDLIAAMWKRVLADDIPEPFRHMR